jgi:multimeric flavodoxin WrbA
MPKILGIGGSPRKGGNSDVLTRAVLEGAAAEGAETESAHLRRYQFQSCIGCERCRKDEACTGLLDGMQLLYPKIGESKGLVMVSPVHNYNVTALMKAFIDRLYCYYNFSDDRPRQWSSRLADQRRKAVLVAIGEQTEKRDMGFTLEAMRWPLEALGYGIMGELPVMQIFDRGKVAEHSEVMNEARELGRRLGSGLID